MEYRGIPAEHPLSGACDSRRGRRIRHDGAGDANRRARAGRRPRQARRLPALAASRSARCRARSYFTLRRSRRRRVSFARLPDEIRRVPERTNDRPRPRAYLRSGDRRVRARLRSAMVPYRRSARRKQPLAGIDRERLAQLCNRDAPGNRGGARRLGIVRIARPRIPEVAGARETRRRAHAARACAGRAALEQATGPRHPALALATVESARRRGARACCNEFVRSRAHENVMHVDLPALIQAYGYPLTFAGALFEGETVLTLAGLAAHRGHLHWPLLWLLAAAGGTTGDIVYFALGRRYGAELLTRWPSFAPAVERVHRLVE